PFGGILSESSLYRTALISKLSSGRPGSTTFPESPPFCTPSRLSSSSPPPTFLAADEWHLKQCSARAGRILLSKSAMPSSSARTGVKLAASVIRTARFAVKRLIDLSPVARVSGSQSVAEGFRPGELNGWSRQAFRLPGSLGCPDRRLS